MPGYKLLASDKDKLSPKYLCSYCKQLLRDARQTSCGHFYCESCVGSLMKENQMICLEDQETINPKKVYPDNFVRREVLSLVVKCPNTDKGCDSHSEVRNLEEHVKRCEFQEVECIHPECGMKVPRRQLPSHLRTDCKHRMTKCSYCSKDVSVAKMTEHHKNECLMFPVSCPKCDKDGIPRDMMSIHLDPLWGDCSEIEGPCPFSALGCPEKQVMNKNSRTKHLAEKVTVHLSLLQKDYLHLKSRVETPQAVGQRSMSPTLNYPEGKKDKMMKDLMVKVDALMQDNVNMRRKIAEQTSQLMRMGQRLDSASDVEIASSAVTYKTPTDKESNELLKDLRKRITNVENTVAQTQVYHTDNLRRTSEQAEGVAEVKRKSREVVESQRKLEARIHKQESFSDRVEITSSVSYRTPTDKESKERLNDLRKRITNFENTVRRKVEEVKEAQRNLETRIDAQESEAALSNVALADYKITLKEMKYVTHDGILVWKITDVARRRTEAVTGRVLSFYSPQFYSSRQGYRMCAHIYLNGDGKGRRNCISLFFVLMRGEYDALLRWPFRQKVTLMLLDQDNTEHVIDVFRPDPASSSSQRPRGEMNIAGGCPMFCPLSKLDKHAYIRDDTMFIKIIVDTTNMM